MSAQARPLHILFVCVENACRSQLAEAFARHYGGARVMACSAGSRPRGQVDAGAIAVMKERGIDLSRQASKGLSNLPDVTWDAIVTMGCGDACPTVPAKQRFEWQIPDPARPLTNVGEGARQPRLLCGDSGRGQPVEVYRQVRDVIDGAVKALLERLGVLSPVD